jgi:hypothetical protein
VIPRGPRNASGKDRASAVDALLPSLSHVDRGYAQCTVRGRRRAAGGLRQHRGTHAHPRRPKAKGNRHAACGGARSWDLARLLLAESLGIGAAGCVGGLLVAGGCIRAFSIFPRLSVIPLASLDLRVDWRVCVIATSVTVISAVVLGLAPLRQSINLDLIAGLRSRSAAEGTARRGFLQMIQIGVALVLLAGASLFLRTFRHAKAADPFLHSGNLMLANVDTNGP